MSEWMISTDCIALRKVEENGEIILHDRLQLQIDQLRQKVYHETRLETIYKI